MFRTVVCVSQLVSISNAGCTRSYDAPWPYFCNTHKDAQTMNYRKRCIKNMTLTCKHCSPVRVDALSLIYILDHCTLPMGLARQPAPVRGCCAVVSRTQCCAAACAHHATMLVHV